MVKWKFLREGSSFLFFCLFLVRWINKCCRLPYYDSIPKCASHSFYRAVALVERFVWFVQMLAQRKTAQLHLRNDFAYNAISWMKPVVSGVLLLSMMPPLLAPNLASFRWVQQDQDLQMQVGMQSSYDWWWSGDSGILLLCCSILACQQEDVNPQIIKSSIFSDDCFTN